MDPQGWLGIPDWAWLTAFAVAVVSVIGCGWAFRRNVERSLARAGDALKWSEFSAAVRADLAAEGWLLDSHHNASNFGFEAVLRRQETPALLTCRQGSGLRFSREQLSELAEGRDAFGARRAILATNALISPELRQHAAASGIEVIDGRRLWRVLRTHLPAGARRTARQQPYRELTLQVLLGLLLSSLPLLLGRYGGWREEPANVAAESTEAPTDPDSRDQVADSAEATKHEKDSSAPTGANDRIEALQALESLELIRSASWATSSTLSLRLRADSDADVDQAFDVACTTLAAYPALGNIRLQASVRAADGSERSRWRLCQ